MYNMTHEELMRRKNITVLNLIVKLLNYDYATAVKLWYNSKTKRVTLDSDDLYFISPTCCVEQLKLEITNDARWMVQSFE